MDWNGIVEGTSAGVAAALLLGLFAIFRGHIRNLILRWGIRRRFRFLGFGGDLEGATIGVVNHLSRGFRIREATIVTRSTEYRLNPTSEITTSFKQQHPKFTRKQKKLAKLGQPIHLRSTVMFIKQLKPDNAFDEFLEVSPFTERTFSLPTLVASQIQDPIEGIRFVVEYDNYTGGVDIMNVYSTESVKNVQDTIDRLVEMSKRAPGIKTTQKSRTDSSQKSANVPLPASFAPSSRPAKRATFHLPTGVKIEISDFSKTLGDLIRIAREEIGDLRIIPQNFGIGGDFFFVNSSTGSLIDNSVALHRPLSTLFVHDGNQLELRYCQPDPEPDGTILNPMYGVTKFVK